MELFLNTLLKIYPGKNPFFDEMVVKCNGRSKYKSKRMPVQGLTRSEGLKRMSLKSKLSSNNYWKRLTKSCLRTTNIIFLVKESYSNTCPSNNKQQKIRSLPPTVSNHTIILNHLRPKTTRIFIDCFLES